MIETVVVYVYFIKNFELTRLFFPDNVLTFLQSHPLMDEAVAHEHNKPVFFKRDLIFTHLVVDRVTGGTYGQENTYTVYYTGSCKCRMIHF